MKFNMKKSIFTIMAAGLLLFAACDKIPEGEYTIFSGINATWSTPSDEVSISHDQRALVEKYTGPKCVNCPLADETLDAAHHQIGDQLVVVSINHPTGQGIPFNGDPDMRTPGGTAWDEYFGINAIPAAYLNRRTSTQYSSAMTNITAAVQSAIAEQPVVAIAATAVQQTEGQLSIKVRMEMLQAYSKPMTLTVALIEDSLVYRQTTPTGVVNAYKHNHMLRDVLTDYWGTEVQADGTQGEVREAQFATYTLKNPDIKLENCHVVAFVSDRASRQVLNVVQCGIE